MTQIKTPLIDITSDGEASADGHAGRTGVHPRALPVWTIILERAATSPCTIGTRAVCTGDSSRANSTAERRVP